MKLVYTEQALISLDEAMDFISAEVSNEKILEIRTEIFNAADILIFHPFSGQKEYLLEHLKLDHRRLIEGNYKIIYRLADDCIYVTDIFDTRQDPIKMK